MRTVFLIICLSISAIVAAQKNCFTDAYLQQQKVLDPALMQRISAIESFVRHHALNSPNTASRETSATGAIKIPVVVHVIYKDASQNVSDAQIQSQIDALNRDFRRKNADTSNTPDRFKNVAADVQIEFALATSDPNGNATTGVIRKATRVTYFTSDDKIKYNAGGGDNGWDSRYYLNIWVGNLYNLLGYASVPGGPADKDGVVISTTAFGTINAAYPYNLGRTAVHEVGHWLNLKHIWGDAPCGDDLVDDTPQQGSYTQGCPNGFKSSCDNGALGDMYMNYMDLTNDPCLNMFTEGQKQRMRAMFAKGGPKYEMLSSKGLSAPWAVANNASGRGPAGNLEMASAIRFFPNPTRDVMTLQLDATWIGKSLDLVNMNGAVLKKILIASGTQQVSLSGLPSGVYFLQGVTGSSTIKEKLLKM